MPAADARDRRSRRAALKVLDCDVHPTVSGGMHAIYPYMAEAWSRRFQRKNASMASLALTTKYQHPNGSAIREDARTETGEVGGSDPRIVVSDHIERHGIDGVLLNSLQAAAFCCALASADESIALASAFNDYFVDNVGRSAPALGDGGALPRPAGGRGRGPARRRAPA